MKVKRFVDKHFATATLCIMIAAALIFAVVITASIRNEVNNIETSIEELIDKGSYEEALNSIRQQGFKNKKLFEYEEECIETLNSIGDDYYTNGLYIEAMDYYRASGNEDDYKKAYCKSLFEQASYHIQFGIYNLGMFEMQDALDMMKDIQDLQYLVPIAEDYVKIAFRSNNNELIENNSDGLKYIDDGDNSSDWEYPEFWNEGE